MQVVSTGTSTILSDFEELVKRYTYQHPDNETRDFQFYASNGAFVEVNRKSTLELMRVRNNGNELQRVLKLKVEGLYCVACTKNSQDEMAFGLTNGQMKMYNYKTLKFSQVFKSDIRNAVLFADFNSTDDYIASVFESGQVNLYGVQTKTKFESLNLNMNVTLARFHPTKRLQLTAASLKGTVCVYDVQANRKLFQQIDSHTAPCRDLCMSAANADTLITVGYDCLVNIFDMRSKALSTRLHCNHPLSAVAMSECGLYFCVGNLKGELATFDIRNTADVICIKQMHDQAVARIALLPEDTHTSSVSPESGERRRSRNYSTSAAIQPTKSETSVFGCASGRRDSFCDFLDFHTNKNIDKVTGRFMSRRESFDWDTLNTKASDEASPASNNIGKNNALDDPLDELSSDEPFDEASQSFRFVNTRPRRKKEDDLANKNLFGGRRSSVGANRLMQIKEERTLSSPDSAKSVEVISLNTESGAESENHASPAMNGNDIKSETLPAENSTANASNEVPLPQNVPSNSPEPASIAELRREMNQRFQDLQFMIDKNKWELFSQNFTLHWEQMKIMEEVHERLPSTLTPYLDEISRLRRENEILKTQLHMNR